MSPNDAKVCQSEGSIFLGLPAPLRFHADDSFCSGLLPDAVLLAMLDLCSMLCLPMELLHFQLHNRSILLCLGDRNAYRFHVCLLSAGASICMTHIQTCYKITDFLNWEQVP